jgi:hypothetical protein
MQAGFPSEMCKARLATVVPWSTGFKFFETCACRRKEDVSFRLLRDTEERRLHSPSLGVKVLWLDMIALVFNNLHTVAGSVHYVKKNLLEPIFVDSLLFSGLFNKHSAACTAIPRS